MSSHQSASAKSVEWMTPPEIIKALGPFSLDPCASEYCRCTTAARCYTHRDDGLIQPWGGRVWLNPPYGRETIHWLKKLALHGTGTALVFARTETEMFAQWVWPYASGLLFLEGRLHFYDTHGNRAQNNSGAPSVLIAYGDRDAQRLRLCSLPGAYVEPRERRRKDHT